MQQGVGALNVYFSRDTQKKEKKEDAAKPD